MSVSSQNNKASAVMTNLYRKKSRDNKLNSNVLVVIMLKYNLGMYIKHSYKYRNNYIITLLANIKKSYT